MAAAISAVREKRMGYFRAAKHFKVPKSTLFRLANEKETSIESITKKYLGRQPILGTDIEDLLSVCIVTMQRIFYGFTRKDLHRLVYQFIVKYNINNPFKSGLPGKRWISGFLKRHNGILTIKRPTHDNEFTKETMNQFFDSLEENLKRKYFSAARIFHVDGYGLSITQSKTLNIIAQKESKQIRALTSSQRESLISTVVCMNPEGIFVPPMIILPRKDINEALMRGAPAGSIGKAHPSGWIQTYLFMQWFQHFVDYVKPTESSPVLLILNGHNSYTKNMALVDLAKNNNVTLLSLPPYCTNNVHPLDRTFIEPLKCYYSEEVKLLLGEVNRPLTSYDIVELFGRAYSKCQTIAIAANGFKSAGIYPFNRNISVEAVTDTDTEYIEIDQSHQTTKIDVLPQLEYINVPSPSQMHSVKQRTSSRVRSLAKSATMSSSFYKKVKGNNKCAKMKNNTETESSDSNSGAGYTTDSSDDEATKTKVPPSTEKYGKCLICNKKYGRSKKSEGWVQCLICEMWLHASCGDQETGVYICKYCYNQ